MKCTFSPITIGSLLARNVASIGFSKDTRSFASVAKSNAEALSSKIKISGFFTRALAIVRPNEEQIVANIQKLLPLAEELGVCLLIKTSGIYADTGRLRALLESFASDYTGALWDR